MLLTRLRFFSLGWLLACGTAAAANPPQSTQLPAAMPAAAAATSPATSTSTTDSATADVMTRDGYLLQAGDLLQVSVWKETELTTETVIRPDGGISFPLAGDLEAAGHTVAELTGVLQKRIRKFEPDAVVTVAVKAAIGNRIYVIGKVNKPGDFPLIGPIDVMQALSLAGGATPFADTDSIRILRREGDSQSAISFRYSDVQRGRRLRQNILLKSGDTVVVP